MEPIKFKKDFLMGSATAATQIEGGDTNSNWYTWSNLGKIDRNESSIVAADHYNRVDEDIEIMKQMHQKIYRMGIEWSRIEPEEGFFSQVGLQHYINEISKLNKAGIQVLVTLHHFSHPQWFEEKGQWTKKGNIRYFIRFVKHIVKQLGGLVSEYCTINEPNVFAMDSFIDGKYPPGKKDDLVSYFKVSKNMIEAHILSYDLIHDIRQELGFEDTKVGFAMHLAYFELDSNGFGVRNGKKIFEHVFHEIFLSGMIDGKLKFPLGKKEYEPKLYCDFIGINYYSRHFIYPSKNIGTLFHEVRMKKGLENHEKNDLGWEIYPEGLYKLTKDIYERYHLPIYITENGLADASDKNRAQFIYDHLKEIHKLHEEGVDVQRYYHWSLLDNLEWNDGYEPRFGLVEVDYDTQKRTIRNSGKFYSEIIKRNEITESMIKKYLRQE